METDSFNIFELFDLQRFPNGPALFLLIFYTPIGLVLAIFRFFLSLQLLLVASVMNKTWFITRILFRVCCTVLGIIVTSEGIENLDKTKSKVLISNHVTLIDNIAMETITPCIMKENTSGSPWLIEKALKYSDFGGSKDKENLNSRISETLAEMSVPLLVFPEESTTNGKKGLLQFNIMPASKAFHTPSRFWKEQLDADCPWALELTSNIIPVAIVAERLPFPGMSCSVLGSQWWSDLFWFLFVPYTRFHIRFLPPLSKREKQSTEEFCQDAEKAVAACLGIRTTNFTSADKNSLQKELDWQAEVQQSLQCKASSSYSGNETASTSQPSGSESKPSPGHDTILHKMALQVKEVLPQVPLEDIEKDLGKTKCVDTTIANIIEKKVVFTEETSQPASTSAQKTALTPSPPRASNAASFFSASSEQRQQSFEERKRAMIEEARRRYIAKHGL